MQPEALKSVQHWVQRAKRGDPSARAHITEMLNDPTFLLHFHDLAGRVRAALARKFVRNDWFGGQIIFRELDSLRGDLVGPNPSAAERLLAERVVIGWLEVHAAEYSLAVTDSKFRLHWQKQVDHAHRRFLAALRMLTTVRRLPRAALQVNIGEQQVNVSG
jgi:hypothetical protein